MSAPGFVDIHSHLIPGIDDGCVSTDDSLACVRTLQAYGFVGTICTPHVCVADYPSNTPQFIAQQMDQLTRRIAAADLDYPIWAGAEIRLNDDTLRWFRRHGVPTLGPSSCVLVDYWGYVWHPFCDEVIEYLFQQGYQPILAHPERMPLDDDTLEIVLLRLLRQGVWLQGNLRCLVGVEGALAANRMRHWLDEQYYRLVATDMHSHQCLDRRLAGIPAVAEQLGAEQLSLLLSQRPAALTQAGNSAEPGVDTRPRQGG